MEQNTEISEEIASIPFLILDLPIPWQQKKLKLTPITYIVGPNGSGKSQFANALRPYLANVRLLGTNRLELMTPALSIFGDYFATGIDKGHFEQIKQNCLVSGAALDTFILLEERLDIQIRVEATLSSLFNRDISMEWDSGRLVPMVSSPGGNNYRLDREECHGIRELTVLLAHLYDERLEHLIIDEPELNLHPQYQSFFMQEVRNITGLPDGTRGKKKVLLTTHSPFIIELRNFEDLDSIYSFSADFEEPRTLPKQPSRNIQRLASLIPHLSAYHKQLFFSDSPIFVEGISDARMVQAIQSARGASITSAGSCIIEADGCEETNKFLELCIQIGKKAYFLYDLDSLFSGNLRQCVNGDESVSSFLTELGLGADFQRFVGSLDQALHQAIRMILDDKQACNTDLGKYLTTLGTTKDILADKEKLAQAKLATLFDLSFKKTELVASIGQPLVNDIEGKFKQTMNALERKNIFLLPAGSLEDYLPAYQGAHYGKKSDGAKTSSVDKEILALQSSPHSETELKARYGALFDNILKLPAKTKIDMDAVLKRHLSKYVHSIQTAFTRNPELSEAELQSALNREKKYIHNFSVENYLRTGNSSFEVDIRIFCGGTIRRTRVSDQTVAGMLRFELSGQ